MGSRSVVFIFALCLTACGKASENDDTSSSLIARGAPPAAQSFDTPQQNSETQAVTQGAPAAQAPTVQPSVPVAQTAPPPPPQAPADAQGTQAAPPPASSSQTITIVAAKPSAPVPSRAPPPATTTAPMQTATTPVQNTAPPTANPPPPTTAPQQELDNVSPADDLSTTPGLPLPPQRIPLPKPRPKQATSGDLSSLETELLDLINNSRAQKRLPPLKFSRLQSSGSQHCIGSEGHSEHMGKTRTMAHDQFPQDICIRTGASAENIGYSSGTEIAAVHTVHKLMMDEGPGGGHYDNIMSREYTTVGLGFYSSGGLLWVTEDFLAL